MTRLGSAIRNAFPLRPTAAWVACLGLLVGGSALAAPGDILFEDDFESGFGNWSTTDSNLSGINGRTYSSRRNSLYVQGGRVTTTSVAIDTRVPAIRVTAWIRRGSDSFSEDTDSGDDLYVDYLDSTGSWIPIAQFLGSGVNGAVETLDANLSSDALHSGFRLRFRMPSGSGGPPANFGIGWDYWHIDDLVIEEATPSAGLQLGGCEEFEDGITRWSVDATYGRATTGTQTANSPTHSLALNGGTVSLTSDAIDLTGASGLALSLWLRRGSDAFSEDPDTGEDFYVDYLDATNNWVNLERFAGNGSTGQIYTPSYALPTSAAHTGFRVRLRMTGNDGIAFDYWHADSVCLAGFTQAAEWRFEEESWDGTRGEVLDESSGGHDGTATGDTQTAFDSPALTGDPGTCGYATFDGDGDGILVPHSDALHGNPGLTYTAWMRPRSADLLDVQFVMGKQVEGRPPGQRSQMALISAAGRLAGTAYTNAGAAVVQTALPPLDQWSHVALVYQTTSLTLYVNGAVVDTLSFSPSTLIDRNRNFGIGRSPVNDDESFDGDLDEVRVYTSPLDAAGIRAVMDERHVCPFVDLVFVIEHDAAGVNCTPEPIRVRVEDTGGILQTGYDGTIELDTQTGTGTWALVSGAGSFSDATADDGLASYTFSTSDGGVAEFSLSYTNGPATFDIDVYDGSTRDDDSEGDITFAASAFTITASPLSNPPPNPIDDPIGTQVAGVPLPLYLTAYGTTPSDPTCGVIETYDGDQSLRFWVRYSDPSSGSIVPTIDGLATGTSQASALDQTVTFTRGQASVSARYKDTGRISISTADLTSAAPLLGATGNFVSQPADFYIRSVTSGAGAPNPGSDTPTGDLFERAGHPFAVVVEALDAEGSRTPNYGREATPEGIRLVASTLVAPAGGRNGTANDGAIGNATSFSAISPAGRFEGTLFSFDEVGAIRLRASVADGNFLGSGNVTGGESGIVGRFAPSRFEVTANVPRFATACAVGAFGWMDQPFSFAAGEEPVFTVTAVNLAGATTRNYSGIWWRITNASLDNRSYGVGTASLDQSGLPATSADPAIAVNGDGTGTLTFSSGSGLTIQRGSPIAPFDAEIALSIDVIDADDTRYAANPFVVGGTSAGSGILFDVSKRFQYGRLRIDNAHGSERVDLTMSLRTQYFDGSVFVDDTNDSCSTIPLSALGLTPTPGSLSTTPSMANSPILSGDAGLSLSAPNATGQVDLSVDLGPGGANLPWLRYDWPSDGNLDGALDDGPSARATFGIWEGRDQVIFMREVY